MVIQQTSFEIHTLDCIIKANTNKSVWINNNNHRLEHGTDWNLSLQQQKVGLQSEGQSSPNAAPC